MSRPPATRAERARRIGLGLAFVLGVAVSFYVGGGAAAWLTGQGWQPSYITPTGFDDVMARVPGASIWEVHAATAPPALVFACAAAVLIAWARLVLMPLAGSVRDPRARGLATWKDLAPMVSAAAVRKAGRFTRPDLPRRLRRRFWFTSFGRRAPLTELGYHLGRLRGTSHDLWADFEVRVRVIARTGWGKTARVLVPIARTLPGAALIASTSADLFRQTVRARQRARKLPWEWQPFTGGRLPWNWRPRPGWKPLTWTWWKPAYETPRPVWVVDFSERDNRFAAGFPRVHWNPVAGCRDLSVALRRGRACVAGAEDGDRSDNDDKFFRDAAMHCISAWYHAADLAGLGMDAVLRWQRNPKATEPFTILERHSAAEPAARTALMKHLDDRAERTTSGVERMIANALFPFSTHDGMEFTSGTSVDLPQLIRDQATIYLLASPSTARAVAPLLTQFADEWFFTCRSVALTYPDQGLPVPAVGVLDELRAGTPIPSLPEVVYEFRKYRVGVVYSVQNKHQEEEVYGDAAESLDQNVGYTIVGGYDRSIADTLIEQGGEVAIATGSNSGPLLGSRSYGDSVTFRPVLSAADMQRLKDGQAIVRMAQAPLFYCAIRSFRDWRNPRLRFAVRREERSVRAQVKVAQAEQNERRLARDLAADAEFAGSTR